MDSKWNTWGTGKTSAWSMIALVAGLRVSVVFHFMLNDASKWAYSANFDMAGGISTLGCSAMGKYTVSF